MDTSKCFLPMGSLPEFRMTSVSSFQPTETAMHFSFPVSKSTHFGTLKAHILPSVSLHSGQLRVPETVVCLTLGRREDE
ncbi:Hypothetical protein SMAX5B_003881 [Scophthalmus maximus]|uniref:Uncharacterized protein n=1 Tax=Scophthalmus maximus TaxID=52904 RepID=A0A2U9AVC3_SCOMX|nr:Hypothetical protein SMAX5B_003881 [Scophthalmus maximus]